MLDLYATMAYIHLHPGPKHSLNGPNEKYSKKKYYSTAYKIHSTTLISHQKAVSLNGLQTCVKEFSEQMI